MHYICTSLPQPYTSPCESSSATSLSSSSSSPSSRPNRLHLPLHLPLDDNTNECRHHRGPGHCTRRHIRRSITARRATPASRRCPLSESASTLSEEDDSVTRTVIPRRPDPNTPSSSSSLYFVVSSSSPTTVRPGQSSSSYMTHVVPTSHQYLPHRDACVQQRQHRAVDRAPQDQPGGLHYLTMICIMHLG